LAPPQHVAPGGTPGPAEYGISFDTSKGKGILGLELSAIEELALDTLVDWQRRGW